MMKQNPDWQATERGLYRRFRFVNFKEAFTFMTEVADQAERLQHHPRWTNEWNEVEIWLLSHDAGGTVTEKDRQLADIIDSLAAKRMSSQE